MIQIKNRRIWNGRYALPVGDTCYTRYSLLIEESRRIMSDSFEGIPRLVWSCRDSKYDNKDAKRKAMDLMSKEVYVNISEIVIRDHTKISI